MRAHLEANLAVLDELLHDVAKLVRPLDRAALNWAPLGEGTNSIAALVVHTVGSTRSWLSRAAGESMPRDREAEFRAEGSAADLVGMLETCRLDLRVLLEKLGALDPAETLPVHRLRGDVDVEVSVSWCVEHSIAHAGEHWGQIQLTAQLFASGGRA